MNWLNPPLPHYPRLECGTFHDSPPYQQITINNSIPLPELHKKGDSCRWVGVSWLGNEAESVNRRAGPSPGAALLVLGSAAGSRHSHASLLAAIPGSCAPSGKDAAITVPYLSQGQVCGASSGSLAPAAPRDGWKSLHFRRVSTTTLMPHDPAGGFSRGEYRPGACWKTKGIAQ